MAIPREIKEGEREKDRELGATGGGREREWITVVSIVDRDRSIV